MLSPSEITMIYAGKVGIERQTPFIQANPSVSGEIQTSDPQCSSGNNAQKFISQANNQLVCVHLAVLGNLPPGTVADAQKSELYQVWLK